MADRGTSDYPMGSDARELERLDVQGRSLAPATRTILELAGLRAGMRVLDLGSGAGDMAFAAADLVGPTGSVVGVERVPAAVERATARAAALGRTNVSFRCADFGTTAPVGGVDAVVCRLALMYARDPAAVLRAQQEVLAPGGIVAAIEFDVTTCRALPSVPLVEALVDQVGEAFVRGGFEIQLGPKLWSVLRDAGLSPRGMVAIQPHLPPTDGLGAALLAGVLRSAAPLVARTQVASLEALGVDTYEERLAAELVAADAVVAYPTLFGAWATTA